MEHCYIRLTKDLQYANTSKPRNGFWNAEISTARLIIVLTIGSKNCSKFNHKNHFSRVLAVFVSKKYISLQEKIIPAPCNTRKQISGPEYRLVVHISRFLCISCWNLRASWDAVAKVAVLVDQIEDERRTAWADESDISNATIAIVRQAVAQRH